MSRTLFGDPDRLWEKYTLAGERAFSRKEYDEAETYWLNALRIAQDLSKSQYMLHVSLIRLALLYKMNGKSEEGEELEKWSRKLWDIQNQNTAILQAPPSVQDMQRTH